MTIPSREAPLDGNAALKRYFKSDFVAGFLVFLIALPLCLGIALASGFPAIAGVTTAVVAGLVVTFLSGAPLTIKGPAAGLIAIALGAVTELGNGDPTLGYRRTLAVIVIAGLVQILLGVLRAGRLADFFPGSAVHGMLAAIGVIIIAKQLHVMLGVTPEAQDPFSLFAELPRSFSHMNPEIALIGALSLVLLFGLPMIPHPLAKRIPAPMIVLLLTVPIGLAFDLDHEHTYTMIGETFEVGPNFLVNVPTDLTAAIVLPDFSALGLGLSWKYVLMFALVGTLESLLTARAIDGLDPMRGQSKYDRDIVAIGVGNTICGMIGGLPMISEIVRSKANLDSGVKSRFANFFHGAFLLGFIAFVPGLVHEVPLAALSAMLVYTGARLASPHEFVRAWKLGHDQVAVFTTTLVVTLATDLLIGVAVGVALEIALHLALGARLGTLFRPDVEAHDVEGVHVLRVRSSATFASYLSLKERIQTAARTHMRVIVDLGDAFLVDPTTQERLIDLATELGDHGMHLEIRGLERHRALGELPNALRKLPTPVVSR
jgi:MFS superfamily sulfate permease-like transporter